MNIIIKKRYRPFLVLLIILSFSSSVSSQSQFSNPSLRKQDKATQLIVNGKPFLVLGGELGNSSASDLKYMKPVWKKLKQMNCNTVLTPVYWELIEPEKGKFDFTLIDSLIESARKNQMKLALLWFGSWKNSMSCYVPSWIKKDYRNYPRAYSEKGIA